MKALLVAVMATKFQLDKGWYWLFDKAGDEHTLRYAREDHEFLSHRVAKLRFVPDLQVGAKEALAKHKIKVSLAHERYCKYVGTPHFQSEERTLTA